MNIFLTVKTISEEEESTICENTYHPHIQGMNFQHNLYIEATISILMDCLFHQYN